MNQVLIVAEALVLGALILAAEWRRPVPRRQIDFLRTTSAVYFICFVVLPLYLQIDTLRDLRGTGWGWLLKSPFDGEGFVYAGAMAFIGYCAMLGGYHLAGGDRTRRSGRPAAGPTAPRPGLRTGSLQVVALLLGAAGLISLAIYTVSIGGLAVLLLQAAAFRGTDPPVITPYAFLKTLAPMVMAGAFLLHGIRSRARIVGQSRRWTFTFIVFLIGSILILIHQAGRFPVAVFLLTFPLAHVLRTGILRLRTVIAVVVLVSVFLLFGKQLFESTMTETGLADRVESVAHDARNGLRLVLIEFAFPSVTAANASLEVPSVIGYRWFYDFPLALEYLVPQRLLGVDHPATVSMVNTERFPAFGTIPVDLVSLGYFSAGVPGIVVLLAMFGGMLAWLDRILPATADPVDCVLRAAWILFVSIRIMYGDPQLIWSGGFHLIVMAVLLFVMRILAERTRLPAPDVSLRAST